MTDRLPAWNRWGLTFSGEAKTAEDAAKAAQLGGWDVRKENLYTETMLDVPRQRATTRISPITGEREVLGVVGDRYQVIQNEEAFDVLTHIVDESGAVFDSAGQNSSGSKVFMTLKMPEGIQIGGEDAYGLHLLAATSHDGSSAFTLAVIANRLACQNAVEYNVKSAPQKWTLRHTASVQGRIEEARQALGLTFAYVESFEREMQELLSQPLAEREWDRIVEELAPETTSEHEGWKRRVTERRETLQYLYHEAPTQEYGRGTRYAALNAAVEYADWYLPIKGKDVDGSRRAERALFGANVQSFKNRAAQLVAA